MTQEEKNIKICENLGWRRWRFGDPWIKGLRLADNRFGGYIRVCTANSDPSSSSIRLDIDETPTQNAVEVIQNYTPRSHWVFGEKICRSLPNHFIDLNACHEMEKMIQHYGVFVDHLATIMKQPRRGIMLVHATAAQRAEAFGLTLNLWKPGE